MHGINLKKGTVCIYGRFTDDLISGCDVIEIMDEKDLVVYNVAPRGSKFFHQGVKGYRKLNSSEKVAISEQIKDFDKSGSSNAKKIFRAFNKALFRSNVGQSYAADSTQKAAN